MKEFSSGGESCYWSSIMDDKNPSFFKGFLAGVLVSHFNKQLLLGALVGVTAGMYYEQEYGGRRRT